MTALVQGDLHVTLPRHVAGWCMLPDEPLARATVEVLVDGQHNMRLLAAGRGDDPGDGRHGFYARLPVPIEGPATRVIEAREVGTGVVFGRVVLFADRIAQPITDRLAALDCRPLRHAGIGAPDRLRPALLDGFGGLAAELRARAGRVWRHEANVLRRRAPMLALSNHPSTSVFVPSAPSMDGTLNRLEKLQTLCCAAATEVFVLDDGADPRGVMLPAIMPGLRYSREVDRVSGTTLNQLALAAKGEMLCFIAEDAPAGPWHWPWHDLPRDATELVLHLGPSLDAALSAVRPAWRPAAQRSKPHGVALAVLRARFIEAGGFDPRLRGPAAFADLAQKCALLGVPAITWRYQARTSRKI
jgi:hypothetical protein